MTRQEENRKHPRVKTHISVRYRKLRDGAAVLGSGTVSKNLSQGGIRFKTSEFVSMACRLILELEIPLPAKTVKAISRVAWIRKAASGDDYEVGNQFLEMSPEDKELVMKYIDKLAVGDEAGDIAAAVTKGDLEAGYSATRRWDHCKSCR